MNEKQGEFSLTKEDTISTNEKKVPFFTFVLKKAHLFSLDPDDFPGASEGYIPRNTTIILRVRGSPVGGFVRGDVVKVEKVDLQKRTIENKVRIGEDNWEITEGTEVYLFGSTLRKILEEKNQFRKSKIFGFPIIPKNK
jgi:hypothetical protein